MAFFDQLEEQIQKVVKTLTAKKIDSRHLKFGGEGEAETGRVSVPTDARSEFLANRAMGDWAEQSLAEALRRYMPDLKVLAYGSSDRIAAGEDGFRDFFLSNKDEVRRYGKRPDLLLTKDFDEEDWDISARSLEETDPIVSRSLAAIEVRSSKFAALKYMAVRKQDIERGVRNVPECPSFTVKVEDLKIVHRWIERHKLPQSYVQVFFDSVFAINVLDIFRIIGSGTGFKITTPEKSQLKSTIMIPISSGAQVGAFTAPPEFTTEVRVTRLGRYDAFVRPVGGQLELDINKFTSVVTAQTPNATPGPSQLDLEQAC